MTVWTVTVSRDGEPITGPIPVDDFTAAGVLAIAADALRIAGSIRPVSVGAAVAAQRHADRPEQLALGDVA